jgi:transcriptional regulator with PAS, ATPase and Fis domain
MIQSANASMLHILALAKNVAQAKSTVLICGESGVGKEEMATWIHHASPRYQKPFVAVNCAALPSDLLESELFGFQRGAFTGAHQNRIGKIESAEGGTFLLDEISELPLDLQGKLLRVIQEKEIDKLGSNETKKVDVRFICTTNRDLKEMVKQGLFRADLFYRINVVPIKIPSLRERYEDIQSLTELFIRNVCKENNILEKKIDDAALSKIKKWSWPGNIRELQNVIERSVLICQSDILTASHILIEGFEETRVHTFSPGMTVQEAEKILILKTLEHTVQNRTHAAKLLGISIRTLRNKLKEYKLEDAHESNF